MRRDAIPSGLRGTLAKHRTAAAGRTCEAEGVAGLRSQAGRRQPGPCSCCARVSPWEMLPLEMGCGWGVTCWRRLRDRQRAGVGDRLHRELLRGLRDAERIGWSRACVDSASIAARRGCRPGTEPHRPGEARDQAPPITDRQGIPLAFLLTAANVHDSVPFEPLLDAVPAVAGKRGRPWRRPDEVHADKACDHRRCRRGIEASQKLSRHRWVVERTFAWITRFRHFTHPSRLHRFRLFARLLQRTSGQVLKGTLSSAFRNGR